MVVAEALDFPGAVTQGFDLPDARLMIASALEDPARKLLEEGKPLPAPWEDVNHVEADLIETGAAIGACRDRSEVERHVRPHRSTLSREGGRHSIFANPVQSAKTPVPRHAEIDNRPRSEDPRTTRHAFGTLIRRI